MLLLRIVIIMTLMILITIITSVLILIIIIKNKCNKEAIISLILSMDFSNNNQKEIGF